MSRFQLYKGIFFVLVTGLMLASQTRPGNGVNYFVFNQSVGKFLTRFAEPASSWVTGQVITLDGGADLA